jgi:hypothetical protein
MITGASYIPSRDLLETISSASGWLALETAPKGCTKGISGVNAIGSFQLKFAVRHQRR